MKDKDDIQDSKLYELDTWRDIVRSDGWVIFKDLLNTHKDFLERQVIISVSTRDFDNAAKYESRADECKKIIQLVTTRLSEIKKEG